MYLSLILFLYSLFSSQVFAHPVSFKGATNYMTWNQPWLSDNWLTYTLNRNFALALRHMRMQMNDSSEMNFIGTQADLLLNRWNGKDYQANIYLYYSYGRALSNGSSYDGQIIGAEIDAEDQDYYFLTKYEFFKTSNNFEQPLALIRLGISPYKAEFNELAAWLIVQYQNHRGLKKNSALTPMLRLYYKNFLYEMGSSFSGDFMTNLMFHF